MGHDVRIKVVFDYECPLLEPRILTNPHMIQTGHIWFFQLAVCFWVLGLPLFAVSFKQGILPSGQCGSRKGMILPSCWDENYHHFLPPSGEYIFSNHLKQI